jgi:hypothetical protein
MSTCPKYGAANPDGATFCGLCAELFNAGKPLEAGPETPPAEKVPWSSLDYVSWPSRQKVRIRKYVKILVPVAVLVIAVAAVVLVLSTRTRKVEGLSQFKSGYSGISFSYPASWEKKDQAFLKHLSKTQDVSSSQGNEVILVKPGEVFFQHLLTLSTENVAAGRDWPSILQGLKSGYDSTSSTSVGSTFTELTLPPASGAKGVVETYYMDQKPPLFEIESYIVRGNVSYTFLFATPLRGSATDDRDARTAFFNILNSLQFQ